MNFYSEQKQSLAERRLKKKHQMVTKIGSQYCLQSPPLRGLVLSGGGAKGVSYAGMIDYLAQNGILQNITHLSGASAGAITASFLALGVSVEDIQKIAKGLDILDLKDRNSLSFRGEGETFRNILDLIYIIQVRDLLKKVDSTKLQSVTEMENLGSLRKKLAYYREALESKGVKFDNLDIGQVVKLSKDPNQRLLINQAFKDKEKVSDGEILDLQFKDIMKLRSLIEPSSQHRLKDLSIVVTNQTKGVTEVFGSTATPEASVAQMVFNSGAHPFLFKPQKDEKGDSIADGGIINNMPVEEMLQNSNLDPEEVLCVKAETGLQSKYNKRVALAGDVVPVRNDGLWNKLVDKVTHKLIGGKINKGFEKIKNLEKVFFNYKNMLYINTGSIDTTSQNLTEEQKKSAIMAGYCASEELLEKRNQKLYFSHPLLAILYSDMSLLDKNIEQLEDESLKDAAVMAKAILMMQQDIINELNQSTHYSHHDLYEKIKFNIQEMEGFISSQGLTPGETEKVLSLCLKQINYRTEGTLELCFRKELLLLYKHNQEISEPKQNNFLIRVLQLLVWPLRKLFSSNDSLQNEKQNIQSEILSTEEVENKHKALNKSTCFDQLAEAEYQDSTDISIPEEDGTDSEDLSRFSLKR